MGQINPFRPIIAPGRIVDRPHSSRDSNGQKKNPQQHQPSTPDDEQSTQTPAIDPTSNSHLDMKA